MEENKYRVIRLFKALSDPTRYTILQRLEKMESISVMTLSELLDKPIPTISRHLRILKNLDLISSHSEGKYVYYSLKNKEISGIIKKLEKIFNRK